VTKERKKEKKKESYLTDAPISISHRLHITIIMKFQKYTYWKEELIIILQLNAVRIVPLVLSKTRIIPQNYVEA